MTSNEIRQQFIDFFKKKDHTFVPSASVVPLDDPTLLFTNAGMNQFKDVFLGKGERRYKRAVNSQKCIRVSGKHNDLEEVGHDTYHHTFFEMLGNWSFGDYYKKEAIGWAWELLTEVWKLPKERLYATVFGGDDADGLEADTEAEELWKTETDIDPSHILRFGKKDNFWEMGASGPCGPCSEIHIDLTPDLSGGKLVNAGVPEVIEIWNLVFIQYNRDTSGVLSPLPARHVDTGAGFERLVAVLQNKNSNYDTDVFTPLLEAIGALTGVPYAQSAEQIAYRVIADHVRMLSFSIADGGMPSNEGRGYVMRRILRRAARYGRKLNFKEPFIYKLVPVLAEQMGGAYPELRERQDHIVKIIRSEEEQFNRTLDRGLDIFAKIEKQLREAGRTVVPGEDVFRLYDTYGFPVDLTRVIAEEQGLTIDTEGFEEAMNRQRERARASAKFNAQEVENDAWEILSDDEDSHFTGYETTRQETEISRYLVKENEILVRLKETPFYAESGGQVGDKGLIRGKDFTLTVTDTQKQGDVIIHHCLPLENFKPSSARVSAEVTDEERRNTIKNHTATHLLQAALQKTLGDHVHQAGSLVNAERLRFDFTHFEKITDDQLLTIERLVNDEIRKNTTLRITHKNFDEAKSEGAMALFGEKYGDVVRTVKIGDFSYELCGGTHVKATGEIGLFLITQESSVASGVRRIEAVTGPRAVQLVQETRDRLHKTAALLNSAPQDVAAKVQNLLDSHKQLERELKEARAQNLSAGMDTLIQQAENINGVRVIVHTVKDTDMNALKDLGDAL
ncbi:MAG: alanine--tRNA ligase, partial [Calditrichaeota bacterium]